MSTEEESTPAPAPEKRPINILTVWILITRILSIGSILPWGGMTLCAFMSYPSDKSFLNMLFMVFFYAYPIIVLVLANYTRTAYNKHQDGVALALSTASILPLVWFLLKYVLEVI